MPPNKHKALSSLCLMAALGAGMAHAQDKDEDTLPRLESTACATQALEDLNASCYTFYGQENWDDPNGNTVELPIGVIDPETETDADAESDPVVFFPGGPGYSILGNADYIE